MRFAFLYFLITVKEYIEENKIQFELFTDCICSYEFTIADYCKIYSQFTETNFKNYVDYKKNLKDIIKYQWKNKCLVCKKHLTFKDPKLTFTKIIFSDKNIQNFLHLSDFKHICCSKCLPGVSKSNHVHCNICGFNHTLEKIKDVIDSNDDSGCYIF